MASVLPLLVSLCPALAAQARTGSLQEALESLKAGDLKRAEAHAKAAASDPATNAVAQGMLGSIRLQQQRYDESVTFLNAALKLNPHLVGVRLNLGEAYLLQGKPAQAESAFAQVLVQDRANTAARSGIAKAQAQRGEWDKAYRTIQPLTRELSRSLDGLMLLASIYAGASKPGDAARAADSWVSLRIDDAQTTADFAQLLVAAGATREALPLVSAATTFATAFVAGEASLKAQDFDAAERYFSRALEFQPGSTACLLKLAGLAETRGEFEKALSFLIRARKQQRNPDVELAFGRVCLRLDLIEDAEQALETAAQLRPEDANSLYALASVRVARRRFDDARVLMEKMVARVPRDSRLRYSLGSVLYLNGHIEDAEREFTESVRLQPEQVASRYYLGVIADDRGNTAEAVRILRDVVRKDPRHWPAWERLGTALMRERSYDEARRAFARAIELNPQSVRANYQLALLLGRMGEKDEAAKQLAAANDLRSRENDKERMSYRLYDPEERQAAPEQ